MNHSSPGSSKSNPALSISKSIDGFLKYKTAEGLSQCTISSYEYTLNHWLNYVEDQDVTKIKTSDLAAYFAWMRTAYKPKRWNGNTETAEVDRCSDSRLL